MNWSKETKIENADMQIILAAVRDTKGIDFTDYAQPSLQRQIIRFCDISRIADVKELVQKIRFEGGFADNFINELTVNVTEMFRDPSFWSLLRDVVLPELSKRAIINVWHAGCSIGEEVFSMAILLKEEGLLGKTRIVASDINMEALKVAQSGVSVLKSQVLNSKNYSRFGGKGKLSDYYKVMDTNVLYDKELIKRVDFKKHDLTSDGNFGVFDLIICRNVFIYFNFSLQEKVLGLFNQSLTKDSFLGIGSKESITWCKGARLLTNVSIEDKVFRRV
jgi:chemotaxis protein methyltransferase CheR